MLRRHGTPFFRKNNSPLVLNYPIKVFMGPFCGHSVWANLVLVWAGLINQKKKIKWNQASVIITSIIILKKILSALKFSRGLQFNSLDNYYSSSFVRVTSCHRQLYVSVMLAPDLKSWVLGLTAWQKSQVSG